MTHLYVSKKIYQFLVITSLQGPDPIKFDETLDNSVEGHFLRLPIPTLGIAVWGFDNLETTLKFCSIYGLHKEHITVDRASS